MSFKYIVGYQPPYVTATIFPSDIDHREIMRTVYGNDMRNVLSAGFGNIDAGGNVLAHGKSVGLNLHSRKEDVVHLKITLALASRNQDPRSIPTTRP